MLTLWPPRGTADRKYQPMKKLHDARRASYYRFAAPTVSHEIDLLSLRLELPRDRLLFLRWNLSTSCEFLVQIISSFFFFLIFGSILWRKGNVCFSKKRLREENRKFSVEFLELKMNFDYSGPRLFYANWREPVARSVTNNCLPRFSIV